jgi:hypothetical protein
MKYPKEINFKTTLPLTTGRRNDYFMAYSLSADRQASAHFNRD